MKKYLWIIIKFTLCAASLIVMIIDEVKVVKER